MTAAPAGLRSYQHRDRPKRPSHSQQPVKEEPNPALQRLRAKLEKGSISATERKILHLLESQTAAQAQAAARAKAAINKATQAPLTSTQIQARFKCRAYAAEIARAKAQTSYVPEGPQPEEEANTGSEQLAPPSFKKRRIDSLQNTHSSRDFWDCYFHQNKRNVKKSQSQHSQQRSQKISASSDDDADQWHTDNDWGFASDSDNCSDDHGEEEEEGAEGNQQQQQPPQSFYKQLRGAVMTSTVAFQQLVKFVHGLPNSVKDQKAAAHLKGLATKKVVNMSDLSSAARQVWLAVHPDKNKSSAAQQASQALGQLLGSFKKNGALN